MSEIFKFRNENILMGILQGSFFAEHKINSKVKNK